MNMEQNGRKLIEVTDINEHGYIGWKFEGSARFASGKVQEDKEGRKYFVSKGAKFYITDKKGDN